MASQRYAIASPASRDLRSVAGEAVAVLLIRASAAITTMAVKTSIRIFAFVFFITVSSPLGWPTSIL
jgi:hypothetical protein